MAWNEYILIDILRNFVQQTKNKNNINNNVSGPVASDPEQHPKLLHGLKLSRRLDKSSNRS